MSNDKHLVLITGAGRSGTSTASGTLHHLGLHVPEPHLQANESNPSGFFESVWPLRFHQRLMAKAVIEQTDGRPWAAEEVSAVIDDEIRAELTDWLRGVAETSDRSVVKDPRSVWVPELWKQCGESIGLQVTYLTMLRHPAEVIGSRKTYYSGYRPGMDPWNFSVMNLCGWINANLTVERLTRGTPRVWLQYHELLADWRRCMAGVRDIIGVELNDDLDPGHHHPVDDFIDPTLRRHEPSWEGSDMPPQLIDIADRTYAACSILAAKGGSDPEAEAELDRVNADYTALARLSEAIIWDGILSARKAGEEGGAELRAEVERLGKRLKKVRAERDEALAQRVPMSVRVYRRLRRR